MSQDSPMLNNDIANGNDIINDNDPDDTPNLSNNDQNDNPSSIDSPSNYINSSNSKTNTNSDNFQPELKTQEQKDKWIKENQQNVAKNGCRRVRASYDYLNIISEGVYGVVHRCRCIKTGDIVALKQIKIHKTKSGFPQSSLREIRLILQLNHINIISVREVVVDKDCVDIYMVMDYAANDIQSIMINNNKWSWSLNHLKCLMYQLLSGVNYLHSMFVLHRDLKTSNLLLTNNGILKICDFGMARSYTLPIGEYTNYVVTLWYRSPELLLGIDKYGPPIDIWSVGCIFAELLTGTVLFPGDGEFNQINLIFALLGTPTESDWPSYPNLPHGPNKFKWMLQKRKIDDKFPTKLIIKKNLKIVKNNDNDCDNKPILFNGHIDNDDDDQDIAIDIDIDMNDKTNTSTDNNKDNQINDNKLNAKRIFTEGTVDFLKQLLIYDPSKRITAKNALLHRFFTNELPKATAKADMPKFEEHHVERHEKRPTDHKLNSTDDANSC